MSETVSIQPTLVHLARLELRFAPPLLYGSHAGDRGFCKIASGVLAGDRLNGRVVDDGGYWLVIRPDGVVELDARMMIAEDDGSLIYLRDRGMIRLGPDAASDFSEGVGETQAHPFRSSPTIELPVGRHDWLSGSVCVGTGHFSRAGSVLDLFEVV
ncbi:hypothetical protein AB7M35_000139 [Amorphus suaedae]